MKETTQLDNNVIVSRFGAMTCCASFVAYGGGVNSTAMLIGMYQHGIRPDAILFSDTGGERPETYKFISEFSDWLRWHDFPEITILRAPNVTLEERCLNDKVLPAIAYGFKSCSQRFKIEPQNKFVNNWQLAKETWARGEKVVKYIGYDIEETRRAKITEDEKYISKYPLIEWEMTRSDCENLCRKYNLFPAKSSCFFCPSLKKGEIKQLNREHPDLMQRALTIEANAELRSIKGLGRRFAWADVIYKDQIQGKLFAENECEIEIDLPCGCYDG